MRRFGAAAVAVALVAACSRASSGETPLPSASASAPVARPSTPAAVTGVPSAATGVPSAQVPPAGGGGGGDPTIARVGPAIDVRPAEAPWTRALDRIVGGPHVSVAVGLGDTIVYAHAGRVDRIPASGQKLLTSIAALDRFGPAHRFPTIAAGRRPRDGVVRGDLWLVGAGDPELHAARLGALADRLVAEGIRRITGSVVGDTSAFGRRWWAPGWVMDLSRLYVRRPTALTYEGNVHAVPELAAAGALTSALRERGVVVGGDATTGDAPDRPHELARVTSAPLHELLVRQNHSSLNLHAEVLLRALGASSGRPTGAGGARAVEGVAADAGLLIRARDGSGLSHGDRISAIELTSMLLIGASRPWGPALEASLPRSGEGTLRGRLLGVPVRAKTGTLFTVPCSTLAGFVRDAGGTRVAFAVLSEGISKSSSMAIEDAVVRLLAASQVG